MVEASSSIGGRLTQAKVARSGGRTGGVRSVTREVTEGVTSVTAGARTKRRQGLYFHGRAEAEDLHRPPVCADIPPRAHRGATMRQSKTSGALLAVLLVFASGCSSSGGSAAPGDTGDGGTGPGEHPDGGD